MLDLKFSQMVFRTLADRVIRKDDSPDICVHVLRLFK